MFFISQAALSSCRQPHIRWRLVKKLVYIKLVYIKLIAAMVFFLAVQFTICISCLHVFSSEIFIFIGVAHSSPAQIKSCPNFFIKGFDPPHFITVIKKQRFSFLIASQSLQTKWNLPLHPGWWSPSPFWVSPLAQFLLMLWKKEFNDWPVVVLIELEMLGKWLVILIILLVQWSKY